MRGGQVDGCRSIRGLAPPAGFAVDGRQPGLDVGILAFGFDAYTVVDCGANALLAAEVTLGRLNRNVPEEELNLLQFASRRMAQTSTCPPKIVWREPLDARFAGVLADHVPDRLLRQTVTPCAPAFVYPPEQFACVQVGSLKPLIENSLDPARHRHCPGVAAFALQVDDGPVVFPLLEVAEVQVHRFVPSKAAGEQDRQECPIPFAF